MLELQFASSKVGEIELGLIVMNTVLVKNQTKKQNEKYEELSVQTRLQHSKLKIGLILYFIESPTQKRIYNPEK